MKKKVWLVLCLLYFVLFACNQDSETDNLATEFSQKLMFDDGKSINVRAKQWGLAGNHEEIVFSQDSIKVASKDKDYIFYTDEVFYKINGNILTIYAPKSGKNIPSLPFNDVKIIVKGLKTAREIREYHVNYEKYGLRRISIYK